MYGNEGCVDITLSDASSPAPPKSIQVLDYRSKESVFTTFYPNGALKSLHYGLHDIQPKQATIYLFKRNPYALVYPKALVKGRATWDENGTLLEKKEFELPIPFGFYLVTRFLSK